MMIIEVMWVVCCLAYMYHTQLLLIKHSFVSTFLCTHKAWLHARRSRYRCEIIAIMTVAAVGMGKKDDAQHYQDTSIYYSCRSQHRHSMLYTIKSSDYNASMLLLCSSTLSHEERRQHRLSGLIKRQIFRLKIAPTDRQGVRVGLYV